MSVMADKRIVPLKGEPNRLQKLEDSINEKSKQLLGIQTEGENENE
jgi:hypothetical protein